MAHAFDANALQFQGEAVPVAEQVASPNALLSIFSLSTNGVLAYRSGGGTARTVVLRDRSGQDRAITPNPAAVRNPRLSPDGKRLAIAVDGDLWVYDLEGRPPIKLTFGRDAATPLWTRDGKRLMFETNVKSEARDASGQPVQVAQGSLLSIAADGSDPMPEPVSPPGHFHAHGWSLSGELIVADMENRDVAKFLPNPKAQVIPVVKTPAAEAVNGLSLSSDGRWLAYVSNATGADEIWVKPFTEAGAPIRVSPAGGIDPLWAKSGRELFYIQGNRLVSMEVDTRSGFAFKPPTPLFDAPALPGQQPPSYDVTADGRFIVLRSSNSVTTPVTVVINWTSKLKK
jgi:Tol biopolymer transport system component